MGDVSRRDGRRLWTRTRTHSRPQAARDTATTCRAGRDAAPRWSTHWAPCRTRTSSTGAAAGAPREEALVLRLRSSRASTWGGRYWVRTRATIKVDTRPDLQKQPLHFRHTVARPWSVPQLRPRRLRSRAPTAPPSAVPSQPRSPAGTPGQPRGRRHEAAAQRRVLLATALQQVGR